MKKMVLSWQDARTEQVLVDVLKSGKIVLATTDTVLGLFSCADSSGFFALNTLKKRSEKPYLLLLSDPLALDGYVDVKNCMFVKNIMKRYWPGPLTIIFKAQAWVPEYMKGPDGTIAFRIPNHEKIRSLVAKTGPLFSTSANLFQKSVPHTFENISGAILQAVECFVGTNQEVNLDPSTIVDCSSGKLVMVREGSISKTALTGVF